MYLGHPVSCPLPRGQHSSQEGHALVQMQELAVVKDVGNLVSIKLPSRKGGAGEVGSSPCSLAEPGARPVVTGCGIHWEGKPDSDSLSGMVAKVNLTFSPHFQQSVWELGYIVFGKEDTLWSRFADIALLRCLPWLFFRMGTLRVSNMG